MKKKRKEWGLNQNKRRLKSIQYRNRKGKWVTAGLIRIISGKRVLILVGDEVVSRKYSNIRFGVYNRVQQTSDRDKSDSYGKKFKTKKRRFKIKKKTSNKKYTKNHNKETTGFKKYNASSQ